MHPLIPFYVFYYVFAVACAFGITLYIIIRLLNKSNNIGAGYGSFDEYCNTFIHRELDLDDIGISAGRRYLWEHGESPFEDNTDAMPEALKANNNDDIYGELEEVDIPLFKPLN